MRWAIFIAAPILAACANHPVDCAMGVYHDDCLPDTLAFRQARVANDDATCRLYGFAVDTPDYAYCRQAIVNERLPEATPGPRLAPVCAGHPPGACGF
jgi:hypothetical protein